MGEVKPCARWDKPRAVQACPGLPGAAALRAGRRTQDAGFARGLCCGSLLLAPAGAHVRIAGCGDAADRGVAAQSDGWQRTAVLGLRACREARAQRCTRGSIPFRATLGFLRVGDDELFVHFVRRVVSSSTAVARDQMFAVSLRPQFRRGLALSPKLSGAISRTPLRSVAQVVCDVLGDSELGAESPSRRAPLSRGKAVARLPKLLP